MKKVSKLIGLLVILTLSLCLVLVACNNTEIKVTTVVDGVETELLVTDNTLEITTPDKTGYTFVGWFTDEELTTAFNLEEYLENKDKKSLKIYAKWTVNEYTITFNSNGGSEVANITGSYNSDVVAPANPTKDGYTFAGWYTDSELTKAYAFGKLTTNVNLYAKWTINDYTITFNSNGGSEVANITGSYNSDVVAPANPTKDGYTFAGWYTDSELTKAYAFGKLTTNVNLYAKWAINDYTITFNSNGGSEVANITGSYNSDVVAPANPTKDGYTFAGWFTDSELTKAYAFGKLTKNETLYAKWTINTYTITYLKNDGTADKTVLTQDYNTVINEPDAVVRTGYTFGGWYADKECTDAKKYTFGSKITANVNLYAKWTVNTYQVTLKYNDLVSTDDVVDVTYDKAYPTLPDCTRTGYTFEGWFTAETGGEKISKNGNYTYAKDMTIYAHWKANTYTIEFNSNGGNDILPKDVTYDQTFVFEIPTKLGYDFIGWNTVDENGYSYILTDKLGNGLKAWHIEWGIGKYENVKVWASWKETVHKVTCTQEQVNGVDAGILMVGENLYTADVAYSKNYTIEATAKKGYEFVGWYIDNKEVSKEATYSSTMPNDNVNYVAKFALIPKFADFEFTSNISSLTITKYNGLGTEVTIPEGTTIIGDGTNVIVSQSITNVVLPNGLKTISAHAFGDVGSPLGIKTINIPSTVETIGDYAFAELYDITTITLPKGLVSLGAHAFDGCSGLTTVNISDLTSLTEIKPYTFYETSLNSNFVIPGNITKIGEYAFAGIGGQDFNPTITVTLEEGVEEIGNHAFDHSYSNGTDSCYSNVKAIVFPKSLKTYYTDSLHHGGADIYYVGTEEEYNTLVKNNNDEDLMYGTNYYYSKNEPTGIGDFWHYDTDGKTPIKW